MKVEQISIFLENKAGRLAEVTGALAEAGVNMKALALADTSEFGILRLIVDKYDLAKTALKAKGFTVGSTSVVAVGVSNTPGGLHGVLKLLDVKGINVEYMYGFPLQTDMGEAVMIFRLDRTELAVEVLQQNGVRVFSDTEICGCNE